MCSEVNPRCNDSKPRLLWFKKFNSKCGTDIFIELKFGVAAWVKMDDQTATELNLFLITENCKLHLLNFNTI